MTVASVAWIIGHQIFPTMTGGHLRSAGVVRALANQGVKVKIYALTGRRSDLGKAKGISMTEPMPGVEQWVNHSLIHATIQGISRRLGWPQSSTGCCEHSECDSSGKVIRTHLNNRE